MFDQVKQYKLDYGDCLVPQRYKDDPSLEIWVEMQFSIFKSGAMHPCEVASLTQLDSVGSLLDVHPMAIIMVILPC
jgi:Helicase associated domain